MEQSLPDPMVWVARQVAKLLDNPPASGRDALLLFEDLTGTRHGIVETHLRGRRVLAVRWASTEEEQEADRRATRLTSILRRTQDRIYLLDSHRDGRWMVITLAPQPKTALLAGRR